MIISIFLILMVLSLVIIWLGYYKEIDILKVSGFTIIFLLGVVILGAGTEGIKYHDGDNLTITDSNVLVTPLYDYYTDHTIGFITSIIGMLGFVGIYLERRGLSEE